ncbi:MAG TPA: FHA domain-containing protein [Propionibacteriaceae bacterium]
MSATCPAGHTSSSEDYCDVCGIPIEAGGGPVGGPGTAPPPTDVPTQAPAGQVCPNCSTQNLPDALFCEACGYDFTTGTMPRSAAPAPPVPAVEAASPVAPPDANPLAPPDANPLAPPDPTPLAPPDAEVVPDPRPSLATPPAEAPGLAWVAEVWIDPAWYEVQESPDALPSPGLPSIVPLRSRSVLIGRKSRSRNINPEIDCEPDTGTSRRQAQLTTDGTRWWIEDLESSNGTFVGAASEPLPEDPIPVGVKRELEPDDRIYVGAWTRLVIRAATEDEQASLS